MNPAISTPETAMDLALLALGRPVFVRWEAGTSARLVSKPLIFPTPGHAFAPAYLPQQLGDPSFRADHGVQLALVSGAMANGIASVDLVLAMARAGMSGYFGAAGCSMDRVVEAVDRLSRELPELPWGVNLIHSPTETDREEAMVDLFLKRRVRRVEASAFLDLTPAIVHYRASGLSRNSKGAIIAQNRVMAKVSRGEVATKFFQPAPAAILDRLVAEGKISSEQATLAGQFPMADDLTAEADSGGHTDNRPLVGLFPSLLSLRDRIQAHLTPQERTRIGAAGGIATPHSVAAAFAMGAAYVVTGSINQACLESGSSTLARRMLCQADPADVIMAPAADMFEMGIKLQVLKRGTLFAPRAQKLYDLYRHYPDLESIPQADREAIEAKIFRAPLAQIWEETLAFFTKRDPAQVERAQRDPKHKMALVFRWYLGLASRWANAGQADRQADFQIWAGPAMGSFNAWVKGSHLEAPESRHAGEINQQLLAGACVLARWRMLTTQGAPLDLPRVLPFDPKTLQPWIQTGTPDGTPDGTPSALAIGRTV